MAVNDFKAAAGDLDDAVPAEPQNLQGWTTRALPTSGSVTRRRRPAHTPARSTSQKHEPAKQGFTRVGG